MDILDLINAARKNEDCSKAATEVFQQKYAEKFIEIEKFPNKYEKYPKQSNDSTELKITNLQAATNMINHFGHLIQNLALMFNEDKSLCKSIQRNEILNIFKAIDAHCRESLVKFALNYNGCGVNNVFNQIKGPFKHVKILTIFLYDMSEQAEDRYLQLNAMFPNIQELGIDLNRNSDPLLNDCELPKLEKLSIGGLRYELNINEPTFIDLLRKNPQITYLTLYDPSFPALRHVKKYLNHLQELNIDTLVKESPDSEKIEENDEIQFLTVERLHLRFGYKDCRPPKAVSFDVNALREIALICDSGNLTDESLNFLLKYTKIQKLLAGSGLHNATLLKLIGQFPELKYAAFDFDEDVTVNNIIVFIKQTPSLNQLEFIYENTESFDVFVNQLQKELGSDFHVKFDKMTTPLTKTVLRKVSIERNGAYLCQNEIHNTVIMFIIAYAFRLFFS